MGLELKLKGKENIMHMYEETIEDKVIQPTGIRAFGWGFLGYLGNNFIIGALSQIGIIVAAIISPEGDGAYAVFALMGFLLALYAGTLFADSRTYKATTTGAYVSIFMNVLLTVITFGAMMSGY